MRAEWITKVMEYDNDIKITKLVRGNGLCEKITSSVETPEEASLLNQDEKPVENEDQSDWLHDMATFLMEVKYPQGLDRAKRIKFRF